MLFFKFQKPGNLEFNMLRRGEVFFASVAELNDANECRPRFILNGTKALWTRLAGYILQEACIRSGFYETSSREETREVLGLSESLGSLLKKQARTQDFGLEKLDALFRELLENVLKNRLNPSQSQLILEASRRFIRYDLPKVIDEQAYIASFSRNAKNPTMWGHYADAERGFVIVYGTEDGTIGVVSPIKMLHGARRLPEDRLGDFEIGIYDEDRLELKPVKYGRKPPKVNAFHRLIPKFSYSEAEDHYDVPLLLGGDAKEKEEHQVGLVKFSDWRYEQEIRVFLPAFGTLPPDVRVMRVSPDNIRGVIFGPRMSERDKVRALLCCHLMRESCTAPNSGALPEFAFFQSMQVLDRFDLKIVPVGILEGLYFDKHLPIKTMDDLDKTSGQRLCEMSQQIENGLQEFPIDKTTSATING